MSEGRARVARQEDVGSTSAGRGSNYFLGFPITPVSGMDVCVVLARPRVAFRPTYIVIPAVIAPDFVILDVKVGKNSQFISSDPMHAGVFSGEVVVLKDAVVKVVQDLPLAMKMDDCRLGEEICLVVQNINACARNFFGAVAGPPL